MSAHDVSGDWLATRRSALEARATAIGDTLDHLTDIEKMLEADGRKGQDPLLVDLRNLFARLRSLQRDYESQAARGS